MCSTSHPEGVQAHTDMLMKEKTELQLSQAGGNTRPSLFDLNAILNEEDEITTEGPHMNEGLHIPLDLSLAPIQTLAPIPTMTTTKAGLDNTACNSVTYHLPG